MTAAQVLSTLIHSSASPNERAAPAIARREWRWVVAAALAVMILVTLPYLVGVAKQDEALRFTGFLITIDDGHTYLAKMAQGARGDWFYTSAYAAEPGQPVFLFPFYYLLGRLTGTDWSARILGYHAARILFGFGYLVATYAWLAEWLPTVRGRRLGFWLVAVGGGLGWATLVVAGSARLEDLPLELYLPEAFSFLSLLTLPHLAAARLGLVLALIQYRRGRFWSAGLALMIVAFLVPLYPVVLGLLLTLGEGAVLAQRAFGRAQMIDAVRRLAALLVPSVPYVVYVLAVSGLDPDLAEFMSQNILLSPAPWHYLLAYGPWLVVGWFGWRRARRSTPALATWAAVWLALGIALTYIPITTQRRIIDGYWLWLAPLAARGLIVLSRSPRIGRLRRALVPTLLALTMPGTLLAWGGALAAAWSRAPIAFVSAGEAAAFDWLSDHAQTDGLVMAAFRTGNRIPAFTPFRAFLGHGVETPDIHVTEAQVARFYADADDSAFRLDLLRSAKVSVVFWGPEERALGGFDPDAWPLLQRVYADQGVSLYTVRDDAAP